MVAAMGRGMKLAPHLCREERVEWDHNAARSSGLDDLWPGARGNVAAIAPLPDGDAELVDVGGHRLGVAVPDSVNRLKV